MTPLLDVIVAGGGAAGLSAALVLGRARRRTLVVDDGHPRNAPSPAAHSVFTRDGTPPAELLETARAQLAPYDSVVFRRGRIVTAAGEPGGASVVLADGSVHRSRQLLLSTGVRDELPPIQGLAGLWGRGVLHCPYCHGWEVRDAPLAVHGAGATAMQLVSLLLQWSRDVVLCTGGPAGLAAEEREALGRHGVRIIETPVIRLEGNGRLERIGFADGSSLSRAALFLRPPQRPAGDLFRQLGCELTEAGFVSIGADHRTSVPGIYAAGDVTTPFQQVIVAAASGAEAAIAMNRALADEDFG
jgi:thioredoxin reductase